MKILMGGERSREAGDASCLPPGLAARNTGGDQAGGLVRAGPGRVIGASGRVSARGSLHRSREAAEERAWST